MTETKKCGDCHNHFTQTMFSERAWNRVEGGRSCRLCKRLQGINNRASNGRQQSEKCASREHYRRRGILLHAEWRHNNAAFVWYMLTNVGLPTNAVGEIDWKMTIDRKDNDGHYEPGNLRWATTIQQAENRRKNTPLEGHEVAF